MSTERLIVIVSCAALFSFPAAGQDSIDGVSFVDRNLAGEIVIGAMRGGFAVLDYDHDGYPDLAIGDSVGKPNRLFHNIPDPQRPGRRNFADATAGSGLNDADGIAREAIGVVAGDYDNDGQHDLFMVGRAANPVTFGLLYRGTGGSFSNVSVAAGIRGSGGNAESASWSDFDLDGDLDLLVAHNAAPFLTLFQNNGNGAFSNAASLLPSVLGYSHAYSHTWLDYDRDGYADCFILTSSGAGHDVVLHNVSDGQGGRRFTNTAQQIGFVGLGPAPMGVAAGDYDLDGDLDLGISDALVGTYFRNNGGTFTKITPFSTMFGWGVDWIDVDNDADLDFYTAGSYGNPNFDNLQRNLGGGVFQNISSVLNTASLPTQFAAQVDFDNNGRQDVIAMNPNLSVSVYENVSTTPGRWMRVVLRGDGQLVNRDAIGAVVHLDAGGLSQVRELVSGSGVTSTEDMRLHFGLGSSSVVDEISILWPRQGSLASRTERYIGPFAVDRAVSFAPTFRAGDLNCDGSINLFDIDPFVAALSDASAFGQLNHYCSVNNADANSDGSINAFDIEAFIDLLAP